MQHSDFERSNESTIENGSQEFSADPTTARIVAALNEGDHDSAGHLLFEAMERSPDDKQLLRLAAKQRRQAERFTRVYALLKETRDAIAEDEFVRAVGAFREAANLSQGFSNLEQATFEVGIDEAGDLGDRNWRIARSLLEDAARLNAKLVVPEELWKQTQAAEREETIANVLSETALAKPAELARARERLTRTLAQYPDDAGLANRLKSIESTIDDKRKLDERQKALKRLTDFRDALQRETDPTEAPKYIPQSEALAAAYAADPEFQKVLEDLKHQVISCERAASALKQDRIEECLEECAWVLSRMRHHQLFLNLKKKAEERELTLADEYTNSVSRIKELLAAGKLAEAETLCAKASAKLPQFEDLKELAREIELRRPKQVLQPQQETVDSARRHVERGERNLHEHQYKISEQYFSDALKLQPEDARFKTQLSGLLYGFARSELRHNPQSARQVLEMAARLFPGMAVPADLAGVLRQRQGQAKEESARSLALSKITALDAQAEAAKKRDELISLREAADKSNFTAASHPDVREATNALFGKINAKTITIDIKQARRPGIYRAVSIAATVILGIGLAYWMNNRPTTSLAPARAPEKAPLAEQASTEHEPLGTTAPEPAVTVAPTVPNTGSLVIHSDVPGAQVVIAGKRYTVSKEPLKVELNADSYEIKGSHRGYKDFGPVTVAVNKAAETVLDVKLTPKPASLEIRGVPPETRIKLDGVLVAKGNANRTLKKELSAGEHSIEVSRNGYVSKKLTREVTPGDVLILRGRDLQLESSDARIAKNNPATPPAPTPSQLADSQWQSLDKNNPDALHAFANQYPDSPWAAQAKQQANTVLVARENNDWNGADRNNRAALQDFLNKHPNGPHAATATNALADLDRKARLADTQTAEETAWKRVDQHSEISLEAFIRESPNSRYRNQADVDLATLRLGRASVNDSAAVLTVIHRLANAWNAKDLESILALDRNLNKRVVKAELSQVKTVQMQISPTSPPQIDGSQAVVLCRRQASQIFSDGTRKDIPESIVSYVLAKHDGSWTIEGTR